MKDKTEREWEEMKMRMFDMEDAMTAAELIITELSRRLVNVETTLATVLADLYPHHFQRCKHCNAVAEVTLLEEHERDCPDNPDNVIH